MTLTRLLVLTFVLFGTIAGSLTTTGCSTRPGMTRQEEQANRERQSIERPARAIDDEASFTDRVGQVVVVIVIVGVTIAGILLPILLI
jgi:hypothetical protein